MTMNLVIGKLVEEGKIDPARRVAEYLPEIGSGYATASVQQLLNMDVANDYTEDYDDPFTSAYLQEEAVGWRLPGDLTREDTTRAFVARITGKDTTNRTGKADYKSANTEVLGWIAERVSGRPLRHFLADIADAAGIEGCLHMTTDRDGVPLVDGGICLTARDLARFGALFVRRGRGVDGRLVGSASFIERTRAAGMPMKAPRDWLRYSNQTNTDGRWLGHGGYGGQYSAGGPRERRRRRLLQRPRGQERLRPVLLPARHPHARRDRPPGVRRRSLGMLSVETTAPGAAILSS